MIAWSAKQWVTCKIMGDLLLLACLQVIANAAAMMMSKYNIIENDKNNKPH